jgi:hypothetical protein
MIIETKYSVGDMVFVLMDNQIHRRKIESIHVDVVSIDILPKVPERYVQYKIYSSDYDGKEIRCESQLFPTWEELIESMNKAFKENGGLKDQIS